LKLDLFQFVYAFILAQILYIWFKSFLFYILRDELDLRLSLTNLFILDTIFSVIFLFVYAFVVIHSLTKRFENKRYTDPLYDVFKHSEEIHFWVSHMGSYVGAMVLISIVSLINIWFPVETVLTRWQFYAVLGLGFFAGLVALVAMWLSIFKERFFKVLKLIMAIFFIIHAAVYFIVDPRFDAEYVMYWFVFAIFTGLILVAFALERSRRAAGLFEKLHHKAGWSAKGKKYMLSN
jgi:hypothetical protein